MLQDKGAQLHLGAPSRHHVTIQNGRYGSGTRRLGQARAVERRHAQTVRRPSSTTRRLVSIRERYTIVPPSVLAVAPAHGGGCCDFSEPGLSVARDGNTSKADPTG